MVQTNLGFVCLTLAVSILVSSCTPKAALNSKLTGENETQNKDRIALAFVGDKSFSNKLDRKDRSNLSAAELKALDYGVSGQEIGWKNEKSKRSGTITAYQPFRVSGANCRKFKHRLFYDGGVRKFDGTACKRSEGVWLLIE